MFEENCCFIFRLTKPGFEHISVTVHWRYTENRERNTEWCDTEHVKGIGWREQ